MAAVILHRPKPVTSRDFRPTLSVTLWRRLVVPPVRSWRVESPHDISSPESCVPSCEMVLRHYLNGSSIICHILSFTPGEPPLSNFRLLYSILLGAGVALTPTLSPLIKVTDNQSITDEHPQHLFAPPERGTSCVMSIENSRCADEINR